MVSIDGVDTIAISYLLVFDGSLIATDGTYVAAKQWLPPTLCILECSIIYQFRRDTIGCQHLQLCCNAASGGMKTTTLALNYSR